jgi:general secretion pathway protein A
MEADLRSIARDAFGVTPDTRFIFMSRSHREALASLVHGIDCDRPFIALIGEPGSGKTTLLFRLLQHYRSTAKTAFVFQTQCNSRELLQYLLADCGIDTAGQDVVTMHSEFNRLLVETHRSGKRFLLFLDEAHNFTQDTLEAIRLLSDFETPQKKLLQVIFSGQPAIDEMLSDPKMHQLRQRIPLICHLEPLSREETGQYVQHRLNLVGAKSGSLFDPRAIDLIHDLTRGLPREIHNLCFGALCLACAMQAEQVNREMVAEVARDLGLHVPDAEVAEERATIAAAASAGTVEPRRKQTTPTSFTAFFETQHAAFPLAQPFFEPAPLEGKDPEPQVRPQDSFTFLNTPEDSASAEKLGDAEELREFLTHEHTPTAAPSGEHTASHRARLMFAAAAGVLLLLGALTFSPIAERMGFHNGMIASASSQLSKVKESAETLLRVQPTDTAQPDAAAGISSERQTQRGQATKRLKPRRVQPAQAIATEASSSPKVVLPPPSAEPPGPVITRIESASTMDPMLASAMAATSKSGAAVRPPISQVVESRLLESPAPAYPPAAEKAGVSGTVELEAVIGTDGRLKDIRVVKGHPLLNDAAIEGAKMQLYSPYLLNSEPQEVSTRLRFVFKR